MIQRLSEIVEAATGFPHAPGRAMSDDDMKRFATLNAAGRLVARFLVSPEAVEVLEEMFEMMFVPGEPISCRDIAGKVLNTIAEQALMEPSHG